MPPTYVASHSCNLLELTSMMAPYLSSSGLKVLRATCREGRVQADRAITALTTRREEPSVDRAPGDDALVRCLDSMLSRGSRIAKLLLHPDVDDDKAEPPAPYENTARALRVLEAFREHQQPQEQQPAVASSPSLTLLSLRDLEFTDELAAAVGSAAPRLESLDIVGKNLSTAAGLNTATPGLCRLITTCAPHLTSLAFKCELHSVTQPLADAIRSCSRLQHLECRLGDWWYIFDGAYDDIEDGEAAAREMYATMLLELSVVNLAGVLRSLPSLRSLGLAYQYVYASQRTADTISSMTQLTRLHFNSPWYGETASVPRLPRNLVHLTLEENGDALQDDDLRLLASELSQLTHLSFLGRVRAMYDEPALPRRSLPLPPALRELHIGCSVRLRGLLALQLPPSLTQLSLRFLNLTNQTYPAYLGLPDQDDSNSASGDEGSGSDSASGDEGSGSGDEAEGDGAEGQAIGAAGGRAGGREDVSPGADGAVALPSLVPSFDEVLEALGLLHGRLDSSRGLVLGPGRWVPPPHSWPVAEGYGFVRLFGVLRPLALRKLELWFGVLEARDVAAMVEQLPWLEDLWLSCQVHPATVPLLSGLHSLERLKISFVVGRGTDAWSTASAVSAALSPLLLLPGPARPRVRIGWSYRDCMRQSVAEREHEAVLAQAVEGGVGWLRQALQGIGREQRAITFGKR